MKILHTGGNGILAEDFCRNCIKPGNEIVCCVRDKGRIEVEFKTLRNVSFVEVDLLNGVG